MVLRVVVLVLSLFALTGCGLIGMGIGAAVPRYSDDAVPNVGSEVKVATESGESFKGALVASDAVRVVVSSDGKITETARERIKTIATRSGTHWKTGLIAGVVIDVLGTAAYVIAWIAAAPFQAHTGPGW